MTDLRQEPNWQHPIAVLCHPLVWSILNAVALASSLLLAWQLILALDEWSERPDAAAFYLIWNFGTTVLWVMEVSFRVYEWRSNPCNSSSTKQSIALVIEWSFAVLFTVDSMKLLEKWKLQKQDIEADLMEVLLNIAAFSYITITTIQESYKSTNILRRRHQYQALPGNNGTVGVGQVV